MLKHCRISFADDIIKLNRREERRQYSPRMKGGVQQNGTRQFRPRRTKWGIQEYVGRWLLDHLVWASAKQEGGLQLSFQHVATESGTCDCLTLYSLNCGMHAGWELEELAAVEEEVLEWSGVSCWGLERGLKNQAAEGRRKGETRLYIRVHRVNFSSEKIRSDMTQVTIGYRCVPLTERILCLKIYLFLFKCLHVSLKNSVLPKLVSANSHW